MVFVPLLFFNSAKNDLVIESDKRRNLNAHCPTLGDYQTFLFRFMESQSGRGVAITICSTCRRNWPETKTVLQVDRGVGKRDYLFKAQFVLFFYLKQRKQGSIQISQCIAMLTLIVIIHPHLLWLINRRRREHYLFFLIRPLDKVRISLFLSLIFLNFMTLLTRPNK